MSTEFQGQHASLGGELIAKAFLDFIEALVRVSLDRIESERGQGNPKASEGGPRMRTRKEAADDLAISVRTLDKFVKEGKIRRRKVGGKWKFDRRDLDKYLDLEG